MKKVLIVNHVKENCGVQQFGKRVAETSMLSNKVEFNYLETNSFTDFKRTVESWNPEIIIYNWYPITMGWLPENFITDNPQYKHYFIHHDGNIRQNFDKMLFFGADDVFDVNHPSQLPIPQEKKVILPRPLFEYEGDYPKNTKLTVGSFGFGFHHKGFDTIVKHINARALAQVKIRFLMPFAHYGDVNGNIARQVAQECHSLNINPNVELEISHDFLPTEGVLKFLASNDINLFHYNNHPNHGISSVLDYALSVRRPIGLSNNSMFRHVLKNEIILTNDNSIDSIYARGVKPLEEYYKKWSRESFVKSIEEFLYAS